MLFAKWNQQRHLSKSNDVTMALSFKFLYALMYFIQLSIYFDIFSEL